MLNALLLCSLSSVIWLLFSVLCLLYSVFCLPKSEGGHEQKWFFEPTPRQAS